MGAKVSGFIKDVAKTAAKAGTSFLLGKIPVVGTPVANWINSQYKQGGRVTAFADGGVVSDKPKMVINTAAQLISVIKKAPEIAEKHGLSPEMVREAIADAKKGEIQVKQRGGMMKKMGGDKVMVHSGGGGHGVSSFAHGGKVLSVF
jgi:methionine aminopeptidase